MRVSILAGLIALVATAGLSWSQEARGTILGRITDTSHAVVPGAKVRATNLATNASFPSQANQEGNYEIPYLLPGRYRVEAEAAGFKTAVRDSIELRIADRMMLDITLQVGQVTESVVVTGQTPLLNTATASVGAVADQRIVTELPIVGGNPFSLIAIAPGVLAKGNNMANPWDWRAGTSNGITVNGGGSTELTLDGVDNMCKSEMAYSPPQDLVQEFKLEAAPYDASLGHSSGSWVNVTMKTGTNDLHGSVYFFDGRLHAVPWFSNRWLYDTTTGPIDAAKRERADPGFLRQRIGATATGPVVLPRLYDGHNRTFWIFGYERAYLRENSTATATVPTAEERNGDFSALLKIGAIYQFYDPLTIAPASSGRFSRQPLAGNVIPASRMDPLGRKILDYWPLPNTAGTIDGQQNFFRIGHTERWNRSLVGRIDHNISQNHRVFLRVNHNYNSNLVQALPSEATGKNPDRGGPGAVLDDVYVFNPRLLLNVRYGITNQVPRTSYLTRGFDLTGFGFSPALVNEIRTKSDPQGIMFPDITTGYAELGGSDFNTRSMTYQTFAGTLTKMAGNHSLRTGGEFRLIRQTTYDFGGVAPALDFGNTWTRGPLDNSPAAPIGQGLASMLLGLPTGGGMSINASRAEQSTFTGAFLQDDWKITRRLTLNLGVRYEYESAVTERYNRTALRFDFGAANPVDAQARANYAAAPIPQVPLNQFRAIGGMTFAGINGLPRETWGSDKNNFAPRVGLALRLTSGTVVRAGYGIFYAQTGTDTNGYSVNQTGFSRRTALISSNDNGLHFLASTANPMPNGLLLPLGASGGLLTSLGGGVGSFPEHMVTPYIQRWSLSIQQQVPGRVVFDLTYLGNRATKLPVGVQSDAIPRQYMSTSPVRDQATIDFLSSQVRNPFAGIDAFAGTGFTGVNINRSQLLRPYPQFTSITQNMPVGYSYYHSLQLSAEKRFSKGLYFLSSWTWSKLMDATSFLNDTDPVPYKVISNLDYTHAFTVSAMYELPMGKGKPLLGRARGIVGALVAGWQAQGLYQGESGPALGFGNAIFNGNLHDIVLPKNQRRAERWFNIDAGFERATGKQLANNIVTFPIRFSGVRADGINNLNCSLFKNFRLTERMKVQFRAEAYNALNHVQFGTPNTTVTSTAFGTITSQKDISQRSMNLAVKLFW